MNDKSQNPTYSYPRVRGRGRAKDAGYVDTEFGPILADPRYGPGTIEKVRNVLTYDPETGEFYRKYSVRGSMAGERAGGVVGGIRVISVSGVRFAEHILAWIFVTGKLPEGRIMHRNGNRLDNRFENLFDNVYLDDQANGVFYRPDIEQFEVRLYTRGSNGRKSFGFYGSYEQASEAAKVGKQLIAQGFHARKVRGLIWWGSTAPPVGEDQKNVAFRNKEFPAVYEAREVIYDLENPQDKWLSAQDPVPEFADGGKHTLWFVSRLRRDTYSRGYPVYGPFPTKSEAEDKVKEYYLLVASGEQKRVALQMLGFLPVRFRKDRVSKMTYFFVAYNQEAAKKDLTDYAECSLIQVQGQHGQKKYVIPFLPNQPSWVRGTFARLDEGDTSAEETWRAYYEYATARLTDGLDHQAALAKVGLGVYDPLLGKAQDTIKVRMGMKDPEPAVIPIYEEWYEGSGVQQTADDQLRGKGDALYKIVGIRGIRGRGGIRKYKEYGPFSSKETALECLKRYLTYREYDESLDIGGHEYALRMSGLVNKLM